MRGRAGLQLHAGKTKILGNLRKRRGNNAKTSATIGDSPIQVLQVNEHTEYLGRLLGFTHVHDAELDHRIAKAWGKFHKFKTELCCKDFPLKHRMRLFMSVISPSVLYGSCCWTMTRERENKLRVAQRHMLRLVCQVRRKTMRDGTLEEWVDWIKRATHFAEDILRQSVWESWVLSQRRRKWRWAGRVARLNDNRWTQQVLLWEPQTGKRRVGRPCLRWAEVITSFFDSFERMSGSDWFLYAQSPEDWKALEDQCCNGELYHE